MFSYIQKSQGIQFYALQTSVPEFLPENLIDFSDEMMTLSDTSALILEMDLVITVDTSIVHLAGALGKAAWLLFPYRYEWRWGLEGEKNSWYESVRVIRQESHGDWLPVLSKVFDEMLPELVTNHPGGVQ
jgi:ADP-heptose:LPS heptosyltransferase